MEHARGRGCKGRETNEPDSLRGNISPLGRDASLWSSVAIIWFNVWTRLVLYILKRSPYFLGGGGEQTFTTKTQEQSILIFLTNGAPHATSRSSVCSARQPSPLSGQNAKWSRALSAADHKYWKEINFAGRKSTFLCSATLSPPKSCWFWGCAHSQHLYFSIVCLPSPLWFFFLGLRIHSKYSNQWNRIFFLCWHYGREAAALGHLQQR